MNNYQSLFGEKFIEIRSDIPENTKIIENRILIRAVTMCSTVVLELQNQYSDCNTAEALKINTLLSELHRNNSLTKTFNPGRMEFFVSLTQRAGNYVGFDICTNEQETLEYLCLAGGRTQTMKTIEKYHQSTNYNKFKKAYHRATINEAAVLIMASDNSITDEEAENKAESSIYQFNEIAFHGWDNRLFLEKILNCHEQHWANKKILCTQDFCFIDLFQVYRVRDFGILLKLHLL